MEEKEKAELVRYGSEVDEDEPECFGVALILALFSDRLSLPTLFFFFFFFLVPVLEDNVDVVADVVVVVIVAATSKSTKFMSHCAGGVSGVSFIDSIALSRPSSSRLPRDRSSSSSAAERALGVSVGVSLGVGDWRGVVTSF